MSPGSKKEGIIQIEEFVAVRKMYMDLMKELCCLAQKDDASSLAKFKARRNEHQELKVAFLEVQKNITMANSRVPVMHVVDITQAFDAFYELFCKVVTIVEQRFPSVTSFHPPSATEQSRLPHIIVPIWTGLIQDYNNFMAIFNAAVHHTRLPAETKMLYLRSYLRGAPLHLIEHLTVSANNYDVAYRLICDRYASMRAQASNLVSQMTVHPPRNAESTSEIQSLLDTFQAGHEALRNLHIPDLGDFIMCSLVLNALSPGLRQAFEEKHHDPSSVPTFNTLMTFLVDRCRIGELIVPSPQPTTIMTSPYRSHSTPYNNRNNPTSAARSPSPIARPSTLGRPFSPNVSRTTMTATPSSPPSTRTTRSRCVYCSNPKHNIRQCTLFKDCSTQEKMDYVEHAQICRNCLSAYHTTNTCGSQETCHRCGRRHHTILHETNASTPQAIEPISSVVLDYSARERRSD